MLCVYSCTVLYKALSCKCPMKRTQSIHRYGSTKRDRKSELRPDQPGRYTSASSGSALFSNSLGRHPSILQPPLTAPPAHTFSVLLTMPSIPPKPQKADRTIQHFPAFLRPQMARACSSQSLHSPSQSESASH